MASADTVLLIDLENMIGANAKRGTLTMKLDVLTSKAGANVQAVAACAGSRINPAGEQVLRDRQIRLLKVSGDKDAADKALLEEAGRLAARGCKRFVVASHDSRFAQLVPRPKVASSAKPAPSAQAPKAEAEPASSPPPRKAAMSAEKSVQAPRPQVRAASVAAVGAGVLTAGILFGAGTVIGASAALRLLRQPDRR